MDDQGTKKSKKALIIVIIILILLAIGGGIAWYIISNMDQNKPDEVISAYFEYLKNADYEGMYSLLSEIYKISCVDHDTYIARNKNIYEGIEATNIEIENLIYDEENKTVNYDMKFDTLARKFYHTILLLLLIDKMIISII